MRGVHSLDPFDPFDRAIGVLMVPRMQTVLLACLLPWAAPSPDRRPDLFAWGKKLWNRAQTRTTTGCSKTPTSSSPPSR